MSLSYFISLQNKTPGFDTFVNGKAIAHASDPLDEIARQVGVKPISEFFGKKWYKPDAGLGTVVALVQYLGEHPDALVDTPYVIDDLKQWEEVLLNAKAANINWKMKIDY